MAKLKIQGIVVFVAVSLFSAITATSAFAEPEWLVEGKSVTSELPVQNEQVIELTDLKTLVGAATIKCDYTAVGTISSKGGGLISEILNTAGERIGELGGLALACESIKGCESTDAEAWPSDDDWWTLFLYFILLEIDIFLGQILNSGSGNPKWEVKCLILGVSIEDACESNSFSGVLENMALPEFLLVKYSEEEGNLGTCSQGGSEAGVMTGEGIVLLTGSEAGLDLTVSG
jgi:hypothetical protein